MSHTLGPWRLSKAGFITNEGSRVITVDREDDYEGIWPVAHVVRRIEGKRLKWNAPDPERDANSHLIAAAPSLLNACKALVKEAKNQGAKYSGHFDLIGDAEAAIARAKGSP